MIRFILGLLAISFLTQSIATAQINNYASLSIADSLTRNADCVIRYYEQNINIVRKDLVQVSEHRTYTILNKEGETPFLYWYDDRHEIKSIDITMYDAKGKRIEKMAKRDFKDFPASGKDEVLDGRLLTASFTYPSYPYTVELIVKKENKETFVMPEFYPIEKARVSIEKAKFYLSKPSDFLIKWKADDVSRSKIDVHPNQQEISYEFTGVKAQKIFDKTQSIYILLAASDFSYANITGKLGDWKSMGQFIFSLNKTQQVVPVALSNELQSMTKNTSDIREKINIVYQYVQDNYRYVSVQLGIGGYQTMPVEVVYNHKFGDCKGLSNLMVSSLREIGIPAFYALALSDDRYREIFPDFTYNCFNHAIVGVPFRQDTIWLECTSNLLPANILSANMNPLVLTIQDDNSNLVRIKNNVMDSTVCNIIGNLSLEGKIEAAVSVKYYHHAFVRPLYFHTNSREMELSFISSHFPEATIDSFAFSYKKYMRSFPVEETFSLQKTCEISSKRIFISRLGFVKIDEIKRILKEVSNDFYHCDSIVLILDDPLCKIENNPFASAKINSTLGSYTCDVLEQDRKLILVRKLFIPAHKKTAANYLILEKFLDEVSILENEKIVLVH